MIQLFILCLSFIAYAEAPSFLEVDKIVNASIRARTLPGAVLIVGNKRDHLHQKVFGKKDHIQENSSGTLYDLASLTKVLATATSIMILEEKGMLSTTNKLSSFYPHYKHDITIEDLLRHTGGLPSGIKGIENETYDDFIERTLSLPLQCKPGTATIYSDVGFIILGDIVQKVSEMSLHDFTRTHIFKPLKMNETTFHVNEEDKYRCAPTASMRPLCIPHDPKAYVMYPKNLGHAGLFSTANDVSRFARMYLNKGVLDDVRILKAETVEKMTVLNGNELRGLGWDLLSPFATAPRGETFPKGISYGHTGYTGTTMWIDPKSESYYVFLSNRVFLGEERTSKPFTQLRKAMSTAIGEVFY